MVSDNSYEYHYSQFQGGKITAIHTHALICYDNHCFLSSRIR